MAQKTRVVNLTPIDAILLRNVFNCYIDNKRIETVEVDLQQMKVVQCYGACDKYTLYHDRIVNLVNGSMNTIKQYMNNNKQLAV